MNFLTLNKKITERQRRAFWLALLPIPVCFLLAAVGEPILFVGYNFKLVTLTFYLVSGYVLELADRIRTEEAG